MENKDNKRDIAMGRGAEFSVSPENGEATATAVEGSYKLHSFNWSAGLDPAPGSIFEVRFKNTRKGFYENVNNLPLRSGDIVAVESSPGHDIGIISLTGDMVERQMRASGFDPSKSEYKKIYRKARPADIEKWQEAIALEHKTMIRSRQIAANLELDMKIGDVEYQGDKIKAIFYYIADARVDFRVLIKLLAEEFKIRIEMKQIGARQEAGRIGGIGCCGRELCCSTWVRNFVSVTTQAARHQDILLNPQKLAGQCSKLKCCLNYEVDSYIDAKKHFPRVNHPLETQEALYYLAKSDIFRQEMSFSSDKDTLANPVTISVARVREIMDMNRRGDKPERLDNRSTASATEPLDYRNVIGDDSITRFDKQQGNRKKKRRGGKPEENPEEAGSNRERPQSRVERQQSRQNGEGRDRRQGQQKRESGESGERRQNRKSGERGERRQSQHSRPNNGERRDRRQGEQNGEGGEKRQQSQRRRGGRGGGGGNRPKTEETKKE